MSPHDTEVFTTLSTIYRAKASSVTEIMYLFVKEKTAVRGFVVEFKLKTYYEPLLKISLSKQSHNCG